jgi:hypothetical protein
MANLSQEFPIESQTSISDKHALLAARRLIGNTGSYRYLEIGSFLGGSLTPFLNDEKCSHILSIDDRGRQQPDERGCKYDYAGVSHDTMLENLRGVGLSTEKIEVFDGSINEYKDLSHRYDLIFIDGEHTDQACFRDFVYSERFLKNDGIIAFHDSTLVHKSLLIICELLNCQNKSYKFIKVKNSEMSFLFFGSYIEENHSLFFDEEPDLNHFHSLSEKQNLLSVVNNRVKIRPSIKKGLKFVIAEVPTRPAF